MSTDYGLDYNRGGTGALGEPAYSFPIGRIRWVIDEHYLFAFRAFELVAGGNDGGEAPGFRGQPLAVFKIDDHVDVRKGYDTSTGEQTNVTSENTTDRPWHERKWIRVDWSQNLLTQFLANDVQSNELFTNFKHEPVPFFFQAGAHDDFPKSYEPQFVRVKDDPDYARRDEWPAEQADTVHYMSFVTQEIWSPRESCLTQGGVCASVTATMRNSFLRVPPRHEYAARTETHGEFDHFGLFRSHEPTYARGGQDPALQHKHCAADADCGAGAACDDAERREAECTKGGFSAKCRKETNVCVGGLTDDRGETDFLRFFVTRHNLYADSLTEQTCMEDWECDGRYEGCTGLTGKNLDTCLAEQGSVCDPAARRCTVPLRKRPTRKVVYHLSPHFPAYLVRRAFDVIGQWNEALMRGQRATQGQLPLDQELCKADRKRVCTTDLGKVARAKCQKDDPTAFCFCGSPEDRGGTCRRDYDSFEAPDDAQARGVPNPYDCYVHGPADAQRPTRYEDYKPGDAYDYEFRGKECLLTLQVNSCDLDADAPCEDLGDLRYHFLSHIQHGGAAFAGVATPLSDPTNGELIVSNATIAAESLESMGTQASQLYPVLRGDVPEDSYFTGENVRGYFARLGRVVHPVATVAATSSGSEPADPSRPVGTAGATGDVNKDLRARMAALQPKLEALRGREGRAQILSDRTLKLKNSALDAQLGAALVAAGEAPAESSGMGQLDAVQAGLEAERQRKQRMAARNMDVLDDALYDSQYQRYFAEAFRGRTTDEASLRMQQAYFEAIALHEMGHALGLRHNFAASLDRSNYQDGYFNLATDTPLPSYLEYDDPQLGGNGDGDIAGPEAQRFAEDLRAAREERLRAGAGNVMSSSVMDYPGDLSDLSGLGRYDRAAALFGYFSKVEAYATGTPDAATNADPAVAAARSLDGLARPDLHRRELFTYYRGGEGCSLDEDCPNHAGRDATAFQPITQRCVPNPRLGTAKPDCSAPGACICSDFYGDFDAYTAGTAYRTGAATYAKVDYLYCHDNRVTDLSWCTPFDAGESFQEVVEHYRRSWRERYPRAYFRNYRASGPDKGAAYPDVVNAVKIYQHMFFRLSYEGMSYQSDTTALGFYDQLLASAGTFDWLAEIIGAPDVGSYQLDKAAKVYRPLSPEPNAPASDLNLGVGQGFYLWSAYQSGQNGFSRLERAGTFLDKLLAIKALAKRDWGLTYQVDEFFYVNFFDFFEQEIVDLFGGLIMRNPRAYAPRVSMDAQGQPVLSYLSAYRGFAGTRANQDTTYPDPAVDGSGTEVLRDIATIEALANFPVYYDTSFEQRLLVWKLGSGDGYKIPATRPDGTASCKYGAAGCTAPDYIVYESDRLHTSYVAVVIAPADQSTQSEQQLSFELLRRLSDRQARVRTLAALTSPSAKQSTELGSLRDELARDESFLEYLIELERSLGISSYFF